LISGANQRALVPPNSPAESFELFTTTHQKGIRK
jgi:hypothetical protein